MGAVSGGGGNGKVGVGAGRGYTPRQRVWSEQEGIIGDTGVGAQRGYAAAKQADKDRVANKLAALRARWWASQQHWW